MSAGHERNHSRKALRTTGAIPGNHDLFAVNGDGLIPVFRGLTPEGYVRIPIPEHAPIGSPNLETGIPCIAPEIFHEESFFGRSPPHMVDHGDRLFHIKKRNARASLSRCDLVQYLLSSSSPGEDGTVWGSGEKSASLLTN